MKKRKEAIYFATYTSGKVNYDRMLYVKGKPNLYDFFHWVHEQREDIEEKFKHLSIGIVNIKYITK